MSPRAPERGAPVCIPDATLITMDAATGSTPTPGGVRIVDGAIAAIGPDVRPEPGDTVIPGRDRLVAPGFVNAHTHSWETLFRGRFEALPLELWMLRSYPLRGPVRVDPDLVALRSTLFAAESLKAGVTTIVDDVLETPDQSFAQLDRIVDAYEAAGIRANVSGHVINRPFVDTLPFLDGLLDPDLLAEVRAMPVQTADEYLEFSRAAFDRYRGRGDGRIGYMLAPSGPQRCTDDLLVGATTLALAEDAECHIHVLETKTQAVTGTELYGRTLVEHLDEIGALSPNTTFAHGIWVTPEDIARIAAADVSVSHNPISNLKLGSGVLPWRAYLDAGVTLGLGTDGWSSSDSPRMLDVVKAAALLHTVHGPDFERWPTVGEVLHAGTVGGARSGILHDRVGSLEIGKRADLVVYDLETLAFTPRNELDIQLVHAENGSSIEYVLVDGRIVVDHGELTQVDERAIVAEFAARRDQLREWQAGLDDLAAAFRPAFAAMHARAQATDIGFTRYLETP